MGKGRKGTNPEDRDLDVESAPTSHRNLKGGCKASIKKVNKKKLTFSSSSHVPIFGSELPLKKPCPEFRAKLRKVDKLERGYHNGERAFTPVF